VFLIGCGVFGETYIAYARQRWLQKVEVNEPDGDRIGQKERPSRACSCSCTLPYSPK
jgi:hypothetical protein